jgi:hypothetical protein
MEKAGFQASSFGTSIMQKTPGYSKDGPESLGQVAA